MYEGDTDHLSRISEYFLLTVWGKGNLQKGKILLHIHKNTDVVVYSIKVNGEFLLTFFKNSKPIYVSTCRFLTVRNDADVRLEQPFRRQFIHFYLKRAN
jgi:hypothetical protein